MRILVAEDDLLLGDALQAGLRQRGFDADWVKDGVAAEVALRSESFGAVVLDLGLPGVDGVEVLRRERARGSTVCVLVLTARDTGGDHGRVIDMGADDYVVKPVDLDELAARLRALGWRSRDRSVGILEVGELRLDPGRRIVTWRGLPVELDPVEFHLLRILMLNAGRVLTQEHIEQYLAPDSDGAESISVERTIDQLRLKLSQEVIRTVRGVGHLLPAVRKHG